MPMGPLKPVCPVVPAEVAATPVPVEVVAPVTTPVSGSLRRPGWLPRAPRLAPDAAASRG